MSGTTLLEIRDRRLYREHYGTFEEYCQDRWGFTKVRATQLIQAAEVTGALEDGNNCYQTPQNEAQARELARLKDPDEIRETWTEVQP